MDITTELPEAVQEILAIEDPVARVQRTHAAITTLDAATKILSAQRRADVTALTEPGGTTINDLAADLNVTPRRIAQIRSTPPPPERAFFGPAKTGLIVAIPQKREIEEDTSARVVSSGALAAWDGLRDLAAELDIPATNEIIRPGASISFNRDGFVLVAGPRHSPVIEQVIQADGRLGFVQDERGWRLVDHSTGTVHQSPLDHGENGDIAYVGRLPRPDQNGNFLYIGSIHAMGAAGAVHWLQDNLSDLYRTARNRRFSFLVRCTYDRQTEQVLSSERITPIYMA